MMTTKFITPNWPAPANVNAYTTLRDAYSEKEQLQTLLSLPSEPIWLKQVHGARVVSATHENKYQEADATFTTLPNQVCVVFTADCLPIFVCDKKGSAVSVIHAGWKGLLSGVIEASLALFQNKMDLLIWFGPAIGANQFEVGKDVYDLFTEK